MASAVSAGGCGAELLPGFYSALWSITRVKHARLVAREAAPATETSTRKMAPTHGGATRFTPGARWESQARVDPCQRGLSLLVRTSCIAAHTQSERVIIHTRAKERVKTGPGNQWNCQKEEEED